MAKSKKKLVFVLLCIVVLIFGGYKIFNKKNNPVSTETIVSNVKSEKVSMPYINPEWTEYMKLSDEEKEKVEQAPQMYIYNYIPEENMYGDYSQLPSSYNVRDEYPTTLYDQGNEGLCWAYATIEMLESNLKVTKNIDAKFSIRQLDCLTANSSYYKNNNNPYSLERSLHDGNYFVADLGLSNSIVASGVMPVLESKFNVNDDEKLDISEVADTNNVDYTVVSAVNFPRYEKNEEYINMLKSFIKKYGAVYIVTVSPNFSAERIGNNNDLHVVDFNLDDAGWGNNPLSGLSYGHAMIIVGWDDSFDVNKDGVADGTWILQNSWNELEYETYYAPYTTDFFYIYGVKEIVEKNWDNSYNMSNSPNIEYQGLVLHQHNENYKGADKMDYEAFSSNELMNRNAISGELIVTYSKSELKKEKLNSINFVSASQNSKYKVYISKNGNKDGFEYIRDVDTDMPGLYTVNFDNIELESDKFAIKIVSDNGALYTIVNAFTSNISEKEREVFFTSSIFDGGFNLNGNYEYNVNTYVKEINYDLIDPETVKYKLHDIDGNELTNNYTKVATINKGKATGIVEIPRKTQMYSKVYLDVIYNNQVMETLEIIYCPKVNLAEMSGKGTEEEPYIITNAEQLSLIANSPSAYYILANDIDLKYDANNDATFNKGFGWKPISDFNGVLDGNGHAIKNMYIHSNVGKGYDESYEKNVGLFTILDGATIKNLKITDANIESDIDVGEAYVGILAGSIKETSLMNIVVDGNLKREFNGTKRSEGTGLIAGRISNNGQIIDKIACIGSIEYGNVRNNGGMFGIIEKDSIVNLSNIFVNANIEKDDRISGINIGGIAGICETNSMSNLKIHNSCIHLISGENNSEENVYIDALVGNSYFEKIGEIQNVLVSNKNINSIIQYNPSADENVRTENIKNLSLDELKLDKQIWEYKEGNPYPTLKVYPYYFATDIDVPETIYLTTARQLVPIPAKVVPESASNRELKYVLPEDQVKVGFGFNEKIYGGFVSDDIILTIKTVDGTNIVKEIPVVVLNKPTINLYDVDYQNYVIDNILPTTIEHYKENIDIKEPYTVKVFKGDEEVTDGNIASGMKTRIYAHDQLVEEYTNVVPGDVDGDGKISSRDVSKVGQYLEGLNIINEQNESYILLAMDFTRDGKVTQNDEEDMQKYVVGIIKRIEEEYYGLIEPYKINKYTVNEDKKIIDNIIPTTIEHYKENIDIQTPYTIKVFKIQKEDNVEAEVTEGSIATGMITKVYLNGESVAEYTNIVPGDLDGDGIIRTRDCSMLLQYLTGMRDNMYGTPAYYAADFTRDGKVRLNDAERIQQYAVKMFELIEEDYYGENN